jgi:hypothetical protein
MHGYPGAPTSWARAGFHGVVEGSLGGTILTGTTDGGAPWAEQWGGLVADGAPNQSAAPCTCCPLPDWARKRAAARQLATAGRPQ